MDWIEYIDELLGIYTASDDCTTPEVREWVTAEFMAIAYALDHLPADAKLAPPAVGELNWAKRNVLDAV